MHTLLSSLARRAPPIISGAIAAIIAHLGVSVAPAWLDVIIVAAWVLGGLAHWYLTRDANGDGEPDAVTMLTRHGWTRADATIAIEGLRRLGPEAGSLIASVSSVSSKAHE